MNLVYNWERYGRLYTWEAAQKAALPAGIYQVLANEKRC